MMPRTLPAVASPRPPSVPPEASTAARPCAPATTRTARRAGRTTMPRMPSTSAATAPGTCAGGGGAGGARRRVLQDGAPATRRRRARRAPSRTAAGTRSGRRDAQRDRDRERRATASGASGSAAKAAPEIARAERGDAVRHPAERARRRRWRLRTGMSRRSPCAPVTRPAAPSASAPPVGRAETDAGRTGIVDAGARRRRDRLTTTPASSRRSGPARQDPEQDEGTCRRCRGSCRRSPGRGRRRAPPEASTSCSPLRPRTQATGPAAGTGRCRGCRARAT